MAITSNARKCISLEMDTKYLFSCLDEREEGDDTQHRSSGWTEPLCTRQALYQLSYQGAKRTNTVR